MSPFNVINPGVMSLLQDTGRYGQHNIGLTVGGPMDPFAFRWANRLCQNEANATVIEVTIGGLQLEAMADTFIAVTGAVVDLKVNNQDQAMWQTLSIKAGDKIKLGFASQGARIYLAVAGGFDVEPQFGSTSTVVREGIGGLTGTESSGKGLAKKDTLSVHQAKAISLLAMPRLAIPNYDTECILHTVLGYQEASFSPVDKASFFSSEYTVSERADRMGYRMLGPQIRSSATSMLSEGICHGAIQVPADGQPIVLLNDRQTIGGYPKIGSVMARDTAKLAQLTQGKKLRFEPISIEDAHGINQIQKYKESNIQLLKLD
ncbi:allophanate hydrolase domain protein/urea amidolyase-like protein [Marinomonas sp. MED121]|uniref:5-oxoprolinase subunit C family protein n=1 Tax=Marinomonas sp. MED121 TaxID=314277 RepID=UPI0000690BF3|nr:biotin-dependent carboxyltransferase family protein [Marinomonas sp. MED121]EAQ64901.1 allophanate hydrolase domain protein/urea amidolyase-like protein [Marinomonas sp. MED121]